MDKIDKIICENINNFIINEASYNRAMKFLVEYEIAIITAWRTSLKDETEKTTKFNKITSEKGKRGKKIVHPELKQNGDEFSTQEKKFYNRELKGALLGLGYGVQKLRGTYREGGINETQEESFLVVNREHDPQFKERVFTLSERYNQDSFIYSPEGSDEAVLIGTNNCDFPGYGNEVASGKLQKYAQSMYMSRVGNKGFTYTNGEKDGDMTDEYANNYEDDSPQTFNQRKAQRIGVDEALNLQTFDKLSINGKHALHLMCGKLIKEIRETVYGQNR